YDSFTFQVRDNGGTANGGADTDATPNTMTIDVTALNDAPFNAGSLPTDIVVTEDVLSNLDLSAVDFDDVDAASGLLTVTISTSTAGELTVAAGTGITLGGSATARTFTGTLANLNAYFDSASNIRYLHPTANLNGDVADTLTLVINDNGNTGAGGGTNQALGVVNVDITAVNDDPTNAGTLPSDVAVTEDVLSNVDLSAVDFADVDAGVSLLTVTLSTSTGGELTVAAGTGITLGGSATVRAFTGTLANLNAYFNTASNIRFLHPTANLNGDDADALTLVINDNGNTGTGGGTNQTLGVVNVDITAVNDPPTQTLPGTQTVAEETTTGISGISIADVDAGLSNVTTRLQVTSGVLSVTLSGGATISAGSNGSGDLTIQGTVAAVNGTLASLTYTGGTDVVGANADTLTVTTNDLGNAGSGGAQQVIGNVQIDITGVNDDPTNAGTLPSDVVMTEDVLSNVDLSAVDFADVDAGVSLLTVTLSTSAGGELTLAAGTGITLGGTATSRTLTGTLANLNTYFNNASNIRYLHPTPNLNGDDVDTLTLVINDNGNTGTGGGMNQTLGVVNVDITAVNDDPVIVSDGGGAVALVNAAENQNSVTTVVSADPDGPPPMYSIIAGADAALFTINPGTGTLRFITAPDFEMPSDSDTDGVYEVTVQVSDGSGGTDTQALSVTVTDQNEAFPSTSPTGFRPMPMPHAMGFSALPSPPQFNGASKVSVKPAVTQAPSVGTTSPAWGSSTPVPSDPSPAPADSSGPAEPGDPAGKGDAPSALGSKLDPQSEAHGVGAGDHQAQSGGVQGERARRRRDRAETRELLAILLAAIRVRLRVHPLRTARPPTVKPRAWRRGQRVHETRRTLVLGRPRVQRRTGTPINKSTRRPA
ncbi:MAG: Ig-like domain-containing protein, partial [Planctomycetota bacterium]